MCDLSRSMLASPPSQEYAPRLNRVNRKGWTVSISKCVSVPNRSNNESDTLAYYRSDFPSCSRRQCRKILSLSSAFKFELK